MLLALGIDLALLVLVTGLLVLGADWFIDGIGDLARALGVSALVLGVILAGFEPEEMLTAAFASGRGAPALAVGNVIGTNITIVAVALGLSALITPIVIDLRVRRQAIIATLASILPIVLLFVGSVNRIAGVLLLALFVGYTFHLFRIDRAAMKRMEVREAREDDDADEEDQGWRPELGKFQWRPLAMTLGGLLAMAVGGPAIVEGALRLAQIAGLGEGVVGATIVSLGTGAEMIALGVTAARKKHTEVLVGGILGSFAYNLLVTLGLAAVIRPLPVDHRLTQIALPIMVAAHLVLLVLVWRGKIGRIMGGIFMLGYVSYLVAVVFGR